MRAPITTVVVIALLTNSQASIQVPIVGHDLHTVNKVAQTTDLAAEALSVFGGRLRGNMPPVLSNWAQDAHEADSEADDDNDDDDDDGEADSDAMDTKLAVDLTSGHGVAPALRASSSESNPLHGVIGFHANKLDTEPTMAAPAHEKEEDAASKAPAGLKEQEAVAKETGKEEEQDEEDDEEDEKEDARGSLEAAKERKKAVESKLEAFNDDEAFDDKIDKDVKMIANETRSPTLSNFLGELRQEMRAYAKPTYPAYLEARAESAEERVKELEKELGEEKAEVKKAETKKDEGKADKKEKGKETVDGDVKAAENVDVKSIAGEAGNSSETWAVSFFANIAFLAAVFAMASTGNDTVRNYTWFLIDQVIAILLAVMYFQAFDSLLDFHALGVHNEIALAVLHAVCLLAMAVVIAYSLRKREVGLAIFCGSAAHTVSFSSIHAAAALQNHFVSQNYFWFTCIFGLAVLGLGLAIVGGLIYKAKEKAQVINNDNFMDKTDDLENDFGSMAFSVVFTMFVRFLLTGHHPVDDETEFDHSATERGYMFIYACVCLVIAGFCVNFCSKKVAENPNNYGLKRAMNFLSTVASMNVAWAFLYWGEWQFFETLYPKDPVKGRVMFAICATIACGLGLIGLTKIPSPQGLTIKKQVMVALTALSLICAWSWELCFDAAVEDMVEGSAHPVGAKIATTVLMFAILVPVYAIYVKPITSKAAEAIGA